MVLTGLVAVLAGSIAYRAQRWLPADRALPGVLVDGEPQPQDRTLGDWLEARRRRLVGREVILDTPTGYRTTTLGALGVEVDVADTLARTLDHAREGSLGARLHRAWSAREGEVDLPLSYRFDSARARSTLAELAPSCLLEATDARLDLVRHRRVPEQPGRALDMPRTLAEVESGGREEGAVFRLHTRVVPAEVTLEMLASVDVSRVLSSYETKFVDSGAGRVKNVHQAAAYLNGHVLAPGQTFSFNQTVGPRELERGFAWAPEIIDDELVPGVGGGTCQVASTLHAAAVLGGLDVVQRRSHSRPSGYAQLGLDATVIYGEVDLKLRNPYETPLIIHAFVPHDRVLKVELLGRHPPGKVDYTYGVEESHDFYRRVTTKSWLSAKRRIRKQRGIRGYDIVSVVRFRRPDGTVQTKSYTSSYRPTPEVFWVGPGYNLDELPELPEGATHVEIDGEQVAGVESNVEPNEEDI